MDQYTEVERESWFKRFKNAILGLLFAPIFIVVGFLALQHGEIEHAKTSSALKKVVGKVFSIPEEGKLFFSCDSIHSLHNTLKDSLISLEIRTNKLFRDVETWQWFEIKKENKSISHNGSTTKEIEYVYEKKWSSSLLNSDTYKYREGHTNPKIRRYSHVITEQDTLYFGSLIVDKKLSEYILSFEPLDIKKMHVRLHKGMHIDTGSVECLGNSLIYPNSLPVEIMNSGSASMHSGESAIAFSKLCIPQQKVHTSFVFQGKGTPQNPQLGDSRIIYWHIPNKLFSIIGQKQGDAIVPLKNDSLFIRSQLACNGVIHSDLGSFAMLFSGKHSKDEMLNEVSNENDIMFVVLRAVGFLFMIGGFALLGNPLRIVFCWIPFIGELWEKLIFKIMMALGVLTSIVISSFYFLTYNSFSNLTIYDLYFGIAVIVFLIFVNNLRISIANYREQF